MTDKKIKCYCSECEKETNHSILFENEKVFNESECYYVVKNQMVLCSGCENIDFRREMIDCDNWVEDENGNGGPAITIEIFPQSKPSYKKLDKLYYLPRKVRLIYVQSIAAVENGDYLLAAMGMRAIIEAVCQDKGIKGGNLQQQIENLKKNRLISASDCDTLHGVRFLGNDAVHEIESPTESAVDVALKVLEHLLIGVYINPQDAEDYLEVAISNYEKFKKIVELEVNKKNVGTKGTLRSFLDKNAFKRFISFVDFEKRYIDEIKKGMHPALKYIGPQSKMVNGRNKTFEIIERI